MTEHSLWPVAEKQEIGQLWESAYQSYKKIYKETNSNESLKKVAWCASRANFHDEAIRYYKMLSEDEPNIAQWISAVGYQFYMKQEWEEAIKWFKKALDIYPDYFVVKYRLGYSLRKLCGTYKVLTKKEFWQALKQYEECDDLWESMSEENKKINASRYANICFQKGKLFIERNEVEQAIDCYNKSLSIRPENEECKYQLSKAFCKKGDIQKALKILPKTSSKYYVTELYINILMKNGDADKAVKMLKTHLITRNKDYLHRELAELLLSQNRSKEAYESAKRSVTMNTKNHINHYVLSKVFFSLGLFIKAEEEAKKAIDCKKEKYSSDYVEARELLDQILKHKDEKSYEKDDEELLKELVEDIGTGELIGYIKTYKDDRGFGFISANGESFFFHISSIPKNLHERIKEGVKVKFEEEKTEKGLSAKKIIRPIVK